jgi:hypothetical protein
MNRLHSTLVVAASIVAFVAAADQTQGPQPGRGGAPAGDPALPPLMQTRPRLVVDGTKPVRSCESLATVALPNTTIESAIVDANNAGICRVVATMTHPPAGDKVSIWIAIPTSNWNGRFLGTGGGGFAGGRQEGAVQARWDHRLRQARAAPDGWGEENRRVRTLLSRAWRGPLRRRPGPQPTGVLDALLAWVEDGKAPETLTATRRDQAGAITRSRPLCQYPLVAKYKCAGSTDAAANFVCSSGF